jgi:hypothetical protein
VKKQSSLGHTLPIGFDKDRNNTYLRYGKVEKTYYIGDKDNFAIPGTVDVALWENGREAGKARGCLVAPERAGYNENTNVPYGKCWTPKKGDWVLVLYIDGMVDSPVVIKSLNYLLDSLNITTSDRLITEDDYVDRDISIHESQAWHKRDKDGNYEFHLPDGTFIQITEDPGSAVFPTNYNDPDTPPNDIDLSEKWGDDNKVEKNIIINHPSGTWVRINSDGSIDMVTKGDVRKQINGNVTEYINGNVARTIDGTLTEIIKQGVDIDCEAGGVSLYKSAASGTNEVEIAQGTKGAARIDDGVSGVTDSAISPEPDTGHTHGVSDTSVQVSQGSDKVKIG